MARVDKLEARIRRVIEGLELSIAGRAPEERAEMLRLALALIGPDDPSYWNAEWVDRWDAEGYELDS